MADPSAFFHAEDERRVADSPYLSRFYGHGIREMDPQEAAIESTRREAGRSYASDGHRKGTCRTCGQHRLLSKGHTRCSRCRSTGRN